MYILYLDASGTVLDPNEQYVVIAGVAIFERQIYYAARALDELAATIDPHHPEQIEFHGSVMHQARQKYKRLGLQVSRKLISDALGALNATHQSTRLFASAVHKAAISPRDPIEYAFEQICNRFDRFLTRLYRVDKTASAASLYLTKVDTRGAYNHLPLIFEQSVTHGALPEI